MTLSIARKARAESLFIRACGHEEAGELRSALRLMLAAAKLGDTSAQVNVGNYYDDGTIVRRNRSAALYWYKRAYRRGVSSGANNIGVLYRKEKKFQLALSWFHRAVALGDDEANIEIGKHYLYNEDDPRNAISYFKRVTPTAWVSEAGAEEAGKLLKEAKKMLKVRQNRSGR